MGPIKIFIFGFVNLALLVGVSLWWLRRAVRQFFYARRSNIKKTMVTSAHNLREAKLRMAKSKKLGINLAGDVEARKKAISLGANEECKTILESAHKQAKHTIENAIRQSENKRVTALKEIKTQMLKNAFLKAEKFLTEKMSSEMKSKALDQSFADMSKLITSDRYNAAERDGAL